MALREEVFPRLDTGGRAAQESHAGPGRDEHERERSRPQRGLEAELARVDARMLDPLHAEPRGNATADDEKAEGTGA